VSPTPVPFELADAVWLTVASAVLFGTSAYVGILISKDRRHATGSTQISLADCVAIAALALGLLFPLEFLPVVCLVVLLPTVLAGAMAKNVVRLALIPIALAVGTLMREALTAALRGLDSWWGPLTCEWLDLTCTAQESTKVLLGTSAMRLGAAVIPYLVRQFVQHMRSSYPVHPMHE
jgi:hypothetical protein